MTTSETTDLIIKESADAANGGCRTGCGACCIAPSISSPIPGMPEGKPAGVRCVQLDEANLCRLFNDRRRPAVCARFVYDADVCGSHRAQALETLDWLEESTGLSSAIDSL